jgi:hypothetical protein
MSLAREKKVQSPNPPRRSEINKNANHHTDKKEHLTLTASSRRINPPMGPISLQPDTDAATQPVLALLGQLGLVATNHYIAAAEALRGTQLAGPRQTGNVAGCRGEVARLAALRARARHGAVAR